jgi:hypothetical protein
MSDLTGNDHIAMTIMDRVWDNVTGCEDCAGEFYTMMSELVVGQYINNLSIEDQVGPAIEDIERLSRRQKTSATGKAILSEILALDTGTMLNNLYTLYRTSLEHDTEKTVDTLSELIDATLESLIEVRLKREKKNAEEATND